MNMTRRDFGISIGIGAFTSGFILEGCSSATVYQDIEAWVCPPGGGVSVLQTAINGIVTLLGPFLPAGAQALISEITAAVTAACAAITEYINTVPPPVGVLAKVMAALQDVATNLQAFLSAFNVNGNPIVAVVIGLAQLILSTIAAFLSKIGAKLNRQAAMRTVVTFGGVTDPIVPQLRTAKSFKNAWNAFADANGHAEVNI